MWANEKSSFVFIVSRHFHWPHSLPFTLSYYLHFMLLVFSGQKSPMRVAERSNLVLVASLLSVFIVSFWWFICAAKSTSSGCRFTSCSFPHWISEPWVFRGDRYGTGFVDIGRIWNTALDSEGVGGVSEIISSSRGWLDSRLRGDSSLDDMPGQARWKQNVRIV